MPLAELHGKIPGVIASLEDTLTSAAFGVLTLLSPIYLAEWLCRARREDGTQLDISPPMSVDAIFWPQLNDPSGRTCEPDVLLSFAGVDGSIVGVLVEVKYKSDLSGWPTSGEDGDVRGQLGREWSALHLNEGAFRGASPDRKVLVYVTTGAVFPTTTFEVVARELHEKTGDAERFRAGAYWVSWFDLSNVARDALDQRPLTHTERVGLTRLHDLLTARRLCAFSGLAVPRMATPLPWRYETEPEAGR